MPSPAAGTSGYALNLAKRASVRFPPILDLSAMNLLPDLGFTIELWVKPQKLANGQTMTLVDFPGQFSLEIFQFLADGSARLAINVEGILRWETSSTVSHCVSNSNTCVWTKVAVVVRREKLLLCVDGLCTDERDLSSGELAFQASASDNYWYLGSRAGSVNFYEGQLDEVRIWNLAREKEYLQDSSSAPNNFRSQATGDEFGLRALYHFDEGYGTTVANAASILSGYGMLDPYIS